MATAKDDVTTQKPKRKYKSKTGRPLEYRDDMPDRAYALITEFGMTDAQLAKAFGVQYQNLREWRKLYPEFSVATKEAKDLYDSGRVEKSLLKRAMGYAYKEVVKEPVSDPETDKQTLEVVREVTKHMPPDPTAMIFWLKNRQPKRWRDTKNIDHAGGVNITHVSNVEEALIKSNKNGD